MARVDAGARPTSASTVPSALPRPAPAEPPPPPPLDPKLAEAVDAVATDPVVHEDFRLLLDGVSAERIAPLLAARLKKSPNDAVGCAYSKAKTALESAAGDTQHPQVAAALRAVSAVLAREAEARRMDLAKAGCGAVQKRP